MVVVVVVNRLKLGRVLITQYYPDILLDLNEMGETEDAILEGKSRTGNITMLMNFKYQIT